MVTGRVRDELRDAAAEEGDGVDVRPGLPFVALAPGDTPTGCMLLRSASVLLCMRALYSAYIPPASSNTPSTENTTATAMTAFLDVDPPLSVIMGVGSFGFCSTTASVL